jgi:dolichol-phosphate mannosyltransferase
LIYIGIHAHDEHQTVGVLLWRLRKLFQEEGQDFHIVVVDDASTDGTFEVLEPYLEILPLTVLRNETRRGHAACTERIIREVLDRSEYHRRDALVTMHPDFTHPPETLHEMLRRYQSGADLVLGVAGDWRGASRSYRMGRWLASRIAPYLPLPPEAEDPVSGYRLYRLFVLHRVLDARSSSGGPLLRHEGWAANAELLALVWPHTRQVEQVEYTFDVTRRYRESRVRFLPQVWGLVRAARDDALERQAFELRTNAESA